MKLLKGHYTFFYTDISFILLFMFPNNSKSYFTFNNIDIVASNI